MKTALTIAADRNISALKTGYWNIRIPVKGPCDSKSVLAAVSAVCLPFIAPLVMIAMTSMSMPPKTKSASNPMKAKRTAFSIACQIPDLARGEVEVVASDRGMLVNAFNYLEVIRYGNVDDDRRQDVEMNDIA
jgi:hypothetical protein